MRIKKVTISGILFLAVLITFSGCSLVFNENIDADLGDLAAFSVGLDTAVRMLANDNDLEESRTVQWGSYNEGSVVIDINPATAYTDNGGSGESLINIPSSSGYLDNFYGNPSLKARFSMKPVLGGSYYEIKLFIYDAADFLLDYVYEEYYVTTSDWAALEADGTTAGYIDYYDNMYDGSKVQHTEYEFGPVVGNVWNISVPSVISENLDAYRFTIRSDGNTPTLFESETEISQPVRTVAGGFDSYKKSTGNYTYEAVSRKVPSRPDFESITYYAELNGQKERNMVVFSLQEVDKEKDSYARGVTRSQEEYSVDNNGTSTDTSDDFLILTTKNQHKLITIAEKGEEPWQHTAKDIEYSIVGGLIEIDHTEGVYYEGSSVDGNPDRRTHMILMQDDVAENDFSGTMTVERTGKPIDSYTVTYDGNKFKIEESGSRAVISGNSIELDLPLMENGNEFTLILPGGSIFEGTYYNSRLTGSLKYPNGDLKSIDILGGVVLLDDKLWEF